MNVTDKTGKVVSAMAVHDNDQLMLMTTKGQSVRIRVAQIRETGRNAQGVRLMNLNAGAGESIQDVAKVMGADEESAPADLPPTSELPPSDSVPPPVEGS